MRIEIQKGNGRNLLRCIRRDNTIEVADLGPSLPYHDIAHFVVETEMSFHRGFYGNIQSGMSIAELNNKEIIKGLPGESWLAEIMTRNLQAIASGAARAEEYIELVGWEISTMNGVDPIELRLGNVQRMFERYTAYVKQWKNLLEGDALVLEF